MPRRTIVVLVISLAFAALCVSLGRWQLRRLAQRRAYNALVASRIAAAPAPLSPARLDTAAIRYRRVALHGAYDFAHEIVLGARSHDGSPGVNFMTPLRVAGTDTAILVNRGWAYAPDAVTVDVAKWREPDTASVVGYVEEFPPPRNVPATSAAHPRALWWLARDSLTRRLPYSLATFYVVALQPTPSSAPVRLGTPPLDEGPHRSYAIQWFAFATIALVGGATLAIRGNQG